MRMQGEAPPAVQLVVSWQAAKALQSATGILRRRFRVFTVLLSLCVVTHPGIAEDGFTETLFEGGRVLEVQVSEEFKPDQRDNVLAWIDFVSTALRDVYGHWPRQRWRVVVIPASAADSDPIPWAQVNRDAIDTVEFFVSPQATTEQLKQEWTGYHELAHLLIPYRGWGGTWFSEGLATYYQGFMQARSGILTEQQAWQSLYDGFMRGRAETQFDGRALRDVSAAMREDGGFMRVYWSGAWYFLAIDIRLRQQSGGRHTLDTALRKLNDCCADKRLSVPQMVSKLDELNGVLLFEQLYDKVDVSTQIPSFETLFASVGVTVVDGNVILQQAGPGALLRQQMASPRAL
jgi:hypothetical protein